jgi:NAD-dependent DNA ligase
MNAAQLELLVMAHRYLYYVLADTVLSDAAYDWVEREARSICSPESPVHGVGSSLPSSYTPQQIEYALLLLERRNG